MKNSFFRILSLLLVLCTAIVLFASCGLTEARQAEEDKIKECSDTELIDPDDPIAPDRLEIGESLEDTWKARLFFNDWGKSVFDNIDITMRNSLNRADMSLLYIDLTIDGKDNLSFSWDDAQLDEYRTALSTAIENMLIHYSKSETEENEDFDYTDEEILANFKELGFDKDSLLEKFNTVFDETFNAESYTVNKEEKTITVNINGETADTAGTDDKKSDENDKNVWEYKMDATELDITGTPFGTVSFKRVKDTGDTEKTENTEKAAESVAESETEAGSETTEG